MGSLVTVKYISFLYRESNSDSFAVVCVAYKLYHLSYTAELIGMNAGETNRTCQLMYRHHDGRKIDKHLVSLKCGKAQICGDDTCKPKFVRRAVREQINL